jgi:hypothetical protein
MVWCSTDPGHQGEGKNNLRERSVALVGPGSVYAARPTGRQFASVDW